MAGEKRYATEMYNKADGFVYTLKDAEAHERIDSVQTSLSGKADVGSSYTKAETNTKLEGYVTLEAYTRLLARVVELEAAVRRISQGGTISEEELEVLLTDANNETFIAQFVDENDNVYQIQFEEVNSQNV